MSFPLPSFVAAASSVLKIWALLIVASLFAGCSERGDKAVAYGDGLGQEWAPAKPHLLRISAENYFTRDVVVHADAPGLHYELTIGPIRKRFMVVPDEKYEITAFADGDTAGNVKLSVDRDDRNGGKGLWVKVRP